MPVRTCVVCIATLAVCAAAIWLPADGLRAQEPAAPAEAGRSENVFLVTSANTRIELIETSSRILQTRGRIVRVDGFDPTVVKVTTLPNTANQIRVQALISGVTSLVLVDEFNSQFSIDVSVVGDVRQLEAIIRKSFPDSTVQAVKIKDSVLLLGWVNQQDQLTPIVEIAEQFHPKVLNYLKVGGVQQVQLRVKVMEVQRSKIRRMGFNFIGLDQNGYFASTPGGLTPVNGITAPFGGPPAASVLTSSLLATTGVFGFTGSDFIFQGFIEALREEALLKILAEPNLISVNGRPASFLSGGEVPVPVPQGLGTVSVQYKEFGVRLQFVPFVLGNGRLRMEVEPEVSERDLTNSAVINGISVPAFTTRRVNTQVEMNFGQSLIVGGLLAKRNTAETKKVPFLGELPYIGAAFRRVREEEAETELMIMVTPELVEGLEPWQAPTSGPGQNAVSPTDKELFGLGMVEVPKTGEECAECDAAASDFYGTPLPEGQHGLPLAAPQGSLPPPAAPPLTPLPEGFEQPLPGPEVLRPQSGEPLIDEPANEEYDDSLDEEAAARRRSRIQPAGRVATGTRSQRVQPVPTTPRVSPAPRSTAPRSRNSRPGLIGPRTSSAGAPAPRETRPGLVGP